MMQQRMIYTWKPGMQKGGAAQAIGEQLEVIRLANHDRLSPRDVVVSARNETSPLHRHFEWRDNVAATKYRDAQARELIRSVMVIVPEQPDAPVPAFVCIEQGAEEFGPYQATRIALADPVSREYVLSRALKELRSWQKRYRDLSELAGVVACMDEHLALLAS